MLGLAYTRVSIYRGTTVNAAGDVEDDNTTPVASGIAASIAVTKASLVYTDANITPRSVNWYRVRLPRRTDVREGDRLKDEKSGQFYLVDIAMREKGLSPAPDLRVEVKKINQTP